MTSEKWLENVRQSFKASLPREEDFWIRQKAAILEQLPPRQNASGLRWHRWMSPALVLVMLVSAQGWRWHRHTVQKEIALAQNIDFLQNMAMIEHLDILEDASLWEKP